jgi:hypothetical protein
LGTGVFRARTVDARKAERFAGTVDQLIAGYAQPQSGRGGSASRRGREKGRRDDGRERKELSWTSGDRKPPSVRAGKSYPTEFFVTFEGILKWRAVQFGSSVTGPARLSDASSARRAF